ncbi:MAG: ribosome small subunit-dependent GTPase A [Armatimonadetes bacterium]|nr:ribosome small subunit-dependent GTPase A [Armatimonadota bacterium]MDE2207616.1 ribosome small subunit-dependent GTPase A [Armatimonadota bacterium]
MTGGKLIEEETEARDRASSGLGPLEEGIVLRATAGEYTVQALDQSAGCGTCRCTLRGNLKKVFTYSESTETPRRVTRARRPFMQDAVAVGDRVRFAVLRPGFGVVEEILPRSSRFARSAFRGRDQTLVSNLDQLVIVFACAAPHPDLWRIDRWLAIAEYCELSAVIVANKRELIADSEWPGPFAEYSRMGYRVVATSAVTGSGVATLKRMLTDKVSAFTGPSGVGKTSLLNRLQPALRGETAAVGGITHKGRHTTTIRELYPLSGGGWLADTPGLRQLNLPPMGRDALGECFVEIAAALEAGCRFGDCTHESEPGCCVTAAVERGEISQRRYRSYLQIATEVAPRA